MTIEKLNTLLVVAEERNITHAAQKLFITQPTLTAFLNKLDAQLGFKIFDRSKTPIVLTPEGKEYIDTIQYILFEEQKLIDRLRLQSNEIDILKIGIGQIHGQLYLPDFSAAMLAIHPDLNIKFHEAQELELIDKLKKNELDLIFGHVPNDNDGIHYEKIAEEKLLLLIPEDLIPSKYKETLVQNGNSETNPLMITPNDLENLPLIMPGKQQGLFMNLKQFLEQYHITCRRTIQTMNMITAAGMVQKGLGYMYASPILVRYTTISHPRKVIFCTLPHLIQNRNYYAVYKENAMQNHLVDEAVKAMKLLINNRFIY